MEVMVGDGEEQLPMEELSELRHKDTPTKLIALTML